MQDRQDIRRPLARRLMGALILPAALLAATPAAFMAGCTTAPKSEAAKEDLNDETGLALKKFRRADAELDQLLNKSLGYAVFPSVGKGGAVVGGAFGRGVLYENGQPAGFCSLSQASIGFQLGGQTYSELIVFQTQAALDNFKNSKFDLSATATAVILKAGAAANAKFDNGAAVFIQSTAGLMYEAAVAGQKFNYEPR